MNLFIRQNELKNCDQKKKKLIAAQIINQPET